MTPIDEYLAELPRDQRLALQRLRAQIRAILPDAEECISYQIPAFRYNGRVIVWFGAGAHHCAFYPGGVVQDYKDELEGFEISKGTIRFQPDKPIPPAVVRKLVKARAAAHEKKKQPSRTRRHR